MTAAPEERFVGIDVGAKRLHLVTLGPQAELGTTAVLDAADTDGLRPHLTDAAVVAIDAPAALSTAPHADDETLAPKFRTGRCAEIDLGRRDRIWVPWVTPTADQPLPGWMKVGFDVFAVANELCGDVIEVSPFAGYRVLAGTTKLPNKQTAAGTALRVDLLRREGLEVEALGMWSHDSLDAALAALIALRKGEEAAEGVTCGHDGTAIFVPTLGRSRSASP